MRFSTLWVCLLVGCSPGPEPLREWTPSDHAQPPNGQIDPHRVPGDTRATVSVGDLLWQKQCARCHGLDGRGGPDAPVNFANAQWQDEASDAAIARIIAAGKPPMPAFGNLLTESQLVALVEHVRGFRPGEKPD